MKAAFSRQPRLHAGLLDHRPPILHPYSIYFRKWEQLQRPPWPGLGRLGLEEYVRRRVCALSAKEREG
jgi:hypothetical protein